MWLLAAPGPTPPPQGPAAGNLRGQTRTPTSPLGQLPLPTPAPVWLWSRPLVGGRGNLRTTWRFSPLISAQLDPSPVTILRASENPGPTHRRHEQTEPRDKRSQPPLGWAGWLPERETEAQGELRDGPESCRALRHPEVDVPTPAEGNRHGHTAHPHLADGARPQPLCWPRARPVCEHPDRPCVRAASHSRIESGSGAQW